MPSPFVAFNHGVASGDPYSDSVILWTRPTPVQETIGQVDGVWEVSFIPDFDQGSIVASGTFSTSAARDWTVKVEADGLSADTIYHYRFRVGDVESMVGQTKTLPVDSDAVRLAVFSCANFPAADTFAAYGRAAAINAVNPYDALVHLGDYIYEYGPGGYGAAEGAATDRGFLPNREIVSLDDYRQRYAQYHTDQNLQALRAAAPLIAIWDDHETANDSWSAGAENHQPGTEGDWIERRDAALKAYYEWLPIREPLLRQGVDQGNATTPLTQGYRSFNFGDVLDLHVLETRLTARDEQLSYPDAAAVGARITAIVSNPTELLAYAGKLGLTPPATQLAIQAFAAALAPAVTQELVLATVQKAWGDPNRDLIGDDQLAWLQKQMAKSNAAWQVLGQQVLMQSMAVPAELLLNAGDPALLDKYAAPLQKLATGTAFTELSPAEQALFSEAGKIPYNLDAWDGYGVERETILQSALGLGKRLINLAGDTHNAWAGVLDTMTPAGTKPAGTAAGVEFATPGVTSPGLEKYLPNADAYIRTKYPAVDGLDGLFSGYISGLKYADLNRRGFLDLTITPEQAVGNFQFLDGVNPSSGLASWSSETVAASTNFTLRMNAAPSELSLANITASIAENTNTSSRIKVADVLIADDNLGDNVISLSGPDADQFEVVALSLFIKAGTALNFEAKTSYTVSVRVTDPALPASNPVGYSYSLSILDVEEMSDPARMGSAGNDSTLPDASTGASAILGFNGSLDTVFTGAGDDEIDIAVTGGGDNRIFTGSGADTIYAGSRDVITGGSGNDWIDATAGNGNRLSGNSGDDDFIIGSFGNRGLGGEGNDRFDILEGAGTNYLSGGAGFDQFWLISAPGDKPAAKQFVMDFKPGEDKVGLQGVSFSALSFTQVGADTLLSVTGTAVGHFTNVSAASLNNQANFLFG
jgi:phosphodiesterase/alkaline phosphatase D-like protein